MPRGFLSAPGCFSLSRLLIGTIALATPFALAVRVAGVVRCGALVGDIRHTFGTVDFTLLNSWYPPTYAHAAWYNPYTGTFGRGAAVYGPYGGARGWGAYNPRTGTFARGSSVYGPYGRASTAWVPRMRMKIVF